MALVAATREAAIPIPSSAGLGAAWHHSLWITGTNPAMFFCRSSPIWFQELPAFFLLFFSLLFFSPEPGDIIQLQCIFISTLATSSGNYASCLNLSGIFMEGWILQGVGVCAAAI